MKTNWGLVDFVKQALAEKWGYVWGTFGHILTPDLLAYKLVQYPGEVGKYETFIKANYLGKRTADCIGLIKAYLWWIIDEPSYDPKTDKSADGMFAMAAEKDIISTLPELPGICLWRKGHVGIYVGSGQVIEAKGTMYGVVQTSIQDGNWTHWWKCPGIEYIPYRDYDDVSSWAREAVGKLRELGIMQGSGEKFRPKDPITREEVAAVIYRTIKYLEP